MIGVEKAHSLNQVYVPLAGHPDCLSIGPAKRQEEVGPHLAPSCACGPPLAQGWGPPAVSLEVIGVGLVFQDGIHANQDFKDWGMQFSGKGINLPFDECHQLGILRD